ncbi:MAG TPA: hypothetical protein VML55_08235, partial [Planctomycetaceae bacterium]|nr:hypothetical protein [Planctomycetaceae bacterium]
SLRPTLLLALALDAATPDQRRELEEIYRPALVPCPSSLVPLDSLRRLFESLRVFEKAEALVDKSRARAEALADEVQPDELRQLLYFLVDTVLAPEEPAADESAPAGAQVLVPLVIGAR